MHSSDFSAAPRFVLIEWSTRKLAMRLFPQFSPYTVGVRLPLVIDMPSKHLGFAWKATVVGRGSATARGCSGILISKILAEAALIMPTIRRPVDFQHLHRLRDMCDLVY